MHTVPIEAAGARALPGRGGVLKLLAGHYEDDVVGEEDGEPVMFFRAARHAVAGGTPLYLDLLANAEPEVRQAAPEALLTCRTDVGPLVEALRERLPLESDPDEPEVADLVPLIRRWWWRYPGLRGPGA